MATRILTVVRHLAFKLLFVLGITAAIFCVLRLFRLIRRHR
jgi:hypothetical protein